MAECLRRRQDDHGAAGSTDASLRYRRDRQRKLALQKSRLIPRISSGLRTASCSPPSRTLRVTAGDGLWPFLAAPARASPWIPSSQSEEAAASAKKADVDGPLYQRPIEARRRYAVTARPVQRHPVPHQAFARPALWQDHRAASPILVTDGIWRCQRGPMPPRSPADGDSPPYQAPITTRRPLRIAARPVQRHPVPHQAFERPALWQDHRAASPILVTDGICTVSAGQCPCARLLMGTVRPIKRPSQRAARYA